MKDRLASLVFLTLVSATRAGLATDEFIPADRLIVVPTGHVIFTAKQGTPYTIPPNGGGGDPTLVGGSLRVWDVGNPSNQEIYALPPAGWTIPGPSRYRYKGAGTPSDPCDVELRDNLIDVDCNAATVTATTPFSGEGGFTLTLGASFHRYCAVLGGLMTANNATIFKRIDAPAPGLCEPTPAPFEEEHGGQVAVVKPQAIARFVSRPGVSLLPDSAGDAPVVDGATIRVFDTGSTAGDISYPLPSTGWKSAGLGYKYRGPAGDPCPVVLLMPRVFKAVCRREAVDLTPPFTGDAAFVITAGAGARYCVQFGGVEIRNDADVFKHTDATAPGSCPSPSGAFLEVGADLFD